MDAEIETLFFLQKVATLNIDNFQIILKNAERIKKQLDNLIAARDEVNDKIDAYQSKCSHDYKFYNGDNEPDFYLCQKCGWYTIHLD